jgi:hypothetical protein
MMMLLWWLCPQYHFLPDAWLSELNGSSLTSPTTFNTTNFYGQLTLAPSSKDGFIQATDEAQRTGLVSVDPPFAVLDNSEGNGSILTTDRVFLQADLPLSLSGK